MFNSNRKKSISEEKCEVFLCWLCVIVWCRYITTVCPLLKVRFLIFSLPCVLLFRVPFTSLFVEHNNVKWHFVAFSGFKYWSLCFILLCTCSDDDDDFKHAPLGRIWWRGWEAAHTNRSTDCSDSIFPPPSPSLRVKRDHWECLFMLCDTELYLLVNKITSPS